MHRGFSSSMIIALLALPAPARAVQDPPATQPAQGLDALDDRRVLTEIAGRGLADLLRHAMDRQDVPEPVRQSLLARISLNRLQGGEALSVSQRRQLVQDVIAAVDQTVAEAEDAQLLFEQAQLLITRGVDEETRLLEYFGDNPDLRAYLEPVTAGIARMLTRASELYDAESQRLANQIDGPNDPVVKQWEQADQLAQRVRDYRIFADYNRLLALAPGDPDRLRLADRLLESVSPADNEENPRRTFVQGYLGKVALARGNEKGFTQAREYLEQVIANSHDESELFDAYFFRTVVEIQDRQVEEAARQYQRFADWFTRQSMPDREPLMLVLDYRLQDAVAQYHRDAAERSAATSRATEVLTTLVEQHEGYRSLVTDLLLARVNSDTDLSELPPLLLDAMVDNGRAEAAVIAQRASEDVTGTSPVATRPAPDREAVERGIAAAEELLRRAEADPQSVDSALVARNAFIRGLMLDILDRQVEAAEAFLAYNELSGADASQRVAALRRALGIVEEMKRTDGGGETMMMQADALEGRLLPLLVGPPVNDKTRAFDLANRLHRLGRLDEAVQYYRQVPENDPRRTDAIYFLLLAETARMGEMSPASPRRADLALELPRLGRRTLEQLSAALAQADGANRDAYRERLARVKVILARLSLTEENDPETALSLLANIESDVNGLPQAGSILSSAIPLRFQATAATGRIDEATRDLLALLEESEAERGLAYISQFRETLNRAIEQARARGDAAALSRLTQTRAAVTPRLVEWMEASDDPEYRRYVYNFRRFDAETQHQAALAARDPEARRAGLREALAKYRALQSQENLELYRSLLEGMSPEQRQSVSYDRDVVFALGNIHYDLAEYEDARSYYGRLLAERAMGNAMRTVQEDGVARQVPNNQFWELYLKFIRSNLALGNPPDPMRQQLRNLYAAYGDGVGGTAWKEEFAELRRELLGEDGAGAGSP